MTMTRQHFALIAGVIRERQATHEHGSASWAALDVLADDMCRALAATNPNFNPSRFLKACGVEG